MIHTDFKPENVVVCLRDEEVEEIHKTGQLTTTKMGKNEHIKNMNMKVAGTLKPPPKTESPQKTDGTASECQSSTTNEVYDPKLFEGLSSKQKKNLRKKLQRQRKKKEKLENSQISSSIDLNESKENVSGGALEDQEIDALDIDIGGESKAAEQKAPEPPKVEKEEEKVSEVNSIVEKSDDEKADEPNEQHGKRGRKLDDKVMVKICDMGNGCWTYHHFTPEIQTR